MHSLILRPTSQRRRHHRSPYGARSTKHNLRNISGRGGPDLSPQSLFFISFSFLSLPALPFLLLPPKFVSVLPLTIWHNTENSQVGHNERAKNAARQGFAREKGFPSPFFLSFVPFLFVFFFF